MYPSLSRCGDSNAMWGSSVMLCAMDQRECAAGYVTAGQSPGNPDGCEVTFSVRAETSFGDRIVPPDAARARMKERPCE